ncbi:TRAP transporter substrate-binding protein [Granulosicoccus antarcticus]|uniref:Monocarboxylate 2-oxoacid-binding periplasmic protein n=1 Tax=Granulosicoccus antarcticus IMCC3135 TaxID=1192854 RepID=A0A2Z2NVC6_9GAMM|nr:TRAP transporter substrate-binding protein [Granulosicoccus antarcticus]ASJ75426.1 Monocarboxylate 2-oxoacid-binding periplasmic protein [Granulosicoccus antarcticus IMCC3135]
MKRRDFVKSSIAGAAASTALITGAPAIAQGKIEWKLPTSFPAKAPGIGTNVVSFAERVAAMSDGRLTFKIFSSGELVPPFAVEDAVQQGTAEIGHSTPYYAAGKNPALHFFSTVPFGMSATEHAAWLRYGGGQELWDEVYAERGLKPFYSGNSGTQSGGWFSKPINSVDDLKGLNMRIAGLGGEAMRALGVNAVLLPPPEIFPAFKSGAIDAAEWVGPLLDQAFGLYKVAKICYVPAFHEPGAALSIVVNQDAFDELPADLQAIVANAAEATSAETLAQFDYFNTQALGQLREEGVEFLEFPDDVVAALRVASSDVINKLAGENAGFKKVMDSYDAFLKPAIEYANLMQGAMYRQRS